MEEEARLSGEEEMYAEGRAAGIRAFAKAILHGDDEHKRWLLEAAECYIAGKPLPPARSAKDDRTRLEQRYANNA